MLISFELTMPKAGSWNGKWSGENDKYFVIKTVSKKYFDNNKYFETLRKNNRDSWEYNFGDGWIAKVNVEIIDSKEAKKRKKISKGFSGYEWMIKSIMNSGEISLKTDIKVYVYRLVYENFKTKYEQGFTKDEIKSITEMFPVLNMDKFNDALMGITCMMIDNEIIVYHCDIEKALLCGIESRSLYSYEFD